MLSPTYTNGYIARQQYYLNMDKQFVEGIKAFKPHTSAPEFVKCNMVIDKAALIAWLNKQPDTIKVDLKASAKGSYYIDVNTYNKPVNKQEDEDNNSDLPF